MAVFYRRNVSTHHTTGCEYRLFKNMGLTVSGLKRCTRTRSSRGMTALMDLKVAWDALNFHQRKHWGGSYSCRDALTIVDKEVLAGES